MGIKKFNTVLGKILKRSETDLESMDFTAISIYVSICVSLRNFKVVLAILCTKWCLFKGNG